MILTEIRSYLQRRGVATLGEIAHHVGSEPEAVRGMLEVWIDKGRVRRHLPTGSCGGGCTQCAPAAIEVYEWLDRAGENAATGPALSTPAGCRH